MKQTSTQADELEAFGNAVAALHEGDAMTITGPTSIRVRVVVGARGKKFLLEGHDSVLGKYLLKRGLVLKPQ